MTLSILLVFIILFIYSNKKVVGISTISRREHLAAQSRELVATREVLPQVTGKGKLRQEINIDVYPYTYLVLELNIVEVAHDYQPQVTRYVTDDLQLLNSYDTWHGNYLVLILVEYNVDSFAYFVRD